MNSLYRTLALLIDHGYILQAEGKRFSLVVVQDPNHKDYGDWAVICNVTGGVVFIVNFYTVYWRNGSAITTTPPQSGRWKRVNSYFEESYNHPDFQEGWIDSFGHSMMIGDPNSGLYFPLGPGAQPTADQINLATRWYGEEHYAKVMVV